MISAKEAFKLADQNTRIAEEMEMIDEEIRRAANEGRFFITWYSDRLIEFQYSILKEKLEDEGYSVTIMYEDNAIQLYIYWHFANEG